MQVADFSLVPHRYEPPAHLPNKRSHLAPISERDESLSPVRGDAWDQVTPVHSRAAVRNLELAHGDHKDAEDGPQDSQPRQRGGATAVAPTLACGLHLDRDAAVVQRSAPVVVTGRAQRKTSLFVQQEEQGRAKCLTV